MLYLTKEILKNTTGIIKNTWTISLTKENGD